MTKQEILDAINATIVANGQKGITAESLANILIEMTNAAGESGSGVLSLQYGVDDSGEYTFTEEQKANNITVYEAILQAFVQGINLPPVFMDGIPLMTFGPTEEDGSITFSGAVVLGGYTDADMPEGYASMGFYSLIGLAQDLILSSDGTLVIDHLEPL